MLKLFESIAVFNHYVVVITVAVAVVVIVVVHFIEQWVTLSFAETKVLNQVLGPILLANAEKFLNFQQFY